MHCRRGGKHAEDSRIRTSLEEPGYNCVHHCRGCGDSDDYYDGDVLASDPLDSYEAEMLLCKITISLFCLFL